MVDGLDVTFALTYLDDVHFRGKNKLPRYLVELRAQSIVGFEPPEHMKEVLPWLFLPAREQLLSQVKRHSRSVDQLPRIDMLVRNIDEMPENRPATRRRRIRPHDFVTGAEILLDRYPESTHWRPKDMTVAIAAWWGIVYSTMIANIRRDGFLPAVRKLNRQVATKIGSLRSPQRKYGMTPEIFVTLGREALTELEGEARSAKTILTLIGRKWGYKTPYRSTFNCWRLPAFREKARSIDEELVACIEDIQCNADALPMERFIAYAEMALDRGMVSVWGMLRFIGEKAKYASTPHATAHQRYLDLYDKIQVAEPGLAALLDQQLFPNQRRATWAAQLDSILAKPVLELCDDGVVRTTSHASRFRTMSRSVLSRFRNPPAFVNRHVSYGIIY